MLEYPGGSSVIRRVFKSGRGGRGVSKRCGNGSRVCSDEIADLDEDGGHEPRNMNSF